MRLSSLDARRGVVVETCRSLDADCCLARKPHRRVPFTTTADARGTSKSVASSPAARPVARTSSATVPSPAATHASRPRRALATSWRRLVKR